MQATVKTGKETNYTQQEIPKLPSSWTGKSEYLANYRDLRWLASSNSLTYGGRLQLQSIIWEGIRCSLLRWWKSWPREKKKQGELNRLKMVKKGTGFSQTSLLSERRRGKGSGGDEVSCWWCHMIRQQHVPFYFNAFCKTESLIEYPEESWVYRADTQPITYDRSV